MHFIAILLVSTIAIILERERERERERELQSVIDFIIYVTAVCESVYCYPFVSPVLF